MEKFLTVWKVAGQSGKFPDSLESFQTAQKIYRQSGKKKLLFSIVSPHKSMEPYRYTINLFLYVLESMNINFQRAGGTLKHVAKTIYALLYMSQKRFTRFWHTCREKNLRTSSGKFLRVKVCQPESWDFLGLCSPPPLPSPLPPIRYLQHVAKWMSHLDCQS